MDLSSAGESRVVVGVDGSEGGYHAMAWAAGEAARLAARLVVVHAYAHPVDVGSVTAAAWRPDPRAEALVARARARYERLARTGALAAVPAEVDFVVAVDPYDPSEGLLEAGCHEADRAGVPLTAAHAAEAGMFAGVTEGDLAWLERLRAEARAGLEARVARWGEKFPDVDWAVDARGGGVPGALLSVLRADDLVVTGSREPAREIGRARGSTLDRLVRHAPCVVTVVHEDSLRPAPVDSPDRRRSREPVRR